MKKLCVLIAILAIACTKPTIESCTDAEGIYKNADFPIGVAVDMVELASNSTYNNVALKQFNSFTPENGFKPNQLHPQENSFNFFQADDLVQTCNDNNIRLHGHTLVWHIQLPQWMLNYEGDWEELLKNHVQTIVSHFKGKVVAWDVVNEAFNEDGTLRNSIWLQKIGSSYIEKAFRYAHEADPNALLFYNDYGLEYNPTKRNATIKLLNNLKARGVKVDGIGLQTHVSTQYPQASQIASALHDVAKNGYKIHISEIDISINPQNQEIKDIDNQFQKQAYVLAEIVSHYKQLPPHLQYGITFWGLSDANSWIRSFYNREDYPLLFDDNYQPKPMYCKLKEAL